MRAALPALALLLLALPAQAESRALPRGELDLAQGLPARTVQLVERLDAGGVDDSAQAARLIGAVVLGIAGCGTGLVGGGVLLFGTIFLAAGGTSATAAGLVLAAVGGLVSLAGIVMLGMTTVFFLENGANPPTTVVRQPELVVTREPEFMNESGELAASPSLAPSH